jgi:hypothetical protein
MPHAKLKHEVKRLGASACVQAGLIGHIQAITCSFMHASG